MIVGNLIIFYVDNPFKSAEYYAKLFNSPIVEQSETFAMLKLPTNLLLGLWSKHTVEPKAPTNGGFGELALIVQEQRMVDELYHLWKEQGVNIAQHPCNMSFGYTFVATDSDHNRIRLFFPS